jgi:preprotein translocase subunit SecG
MQIATISPVLTLIFGVLLIVLVLLQRPQTDSAGAFSTDGGSGTHTRRGGEKLIFNATITAAILFVVFALLSSILKA